MVTVVTAPVEDVSAAGVLVSEGPGVVRDFVLDNGLSRPGMAWESEQPARAPRATRAARVGANG